MEVLTSISIHFGVRQPCQRVTNLASTCCVFNHSWRHVMPATQLSSSFTMPTQNTKINRNTNLTHSFSREIIHTRIVFPETGSSNGNLYVLTHKHLLILLRARLPKLYYWVQDKLNPRKMMFPRITSRVMMPSTLVPLYSSNISEPLKHVDV